MKKAEFRLAYCAFATALAGCQYLPAVPELSKKPATVVQPPVPDSVYLTPSPITPVVEVPDQSGRIARLQADNVKLKNELTNALKENAKLKKDLADAMDDNALLKGLAARKQR